MRSSRWRIPFERIVGNVLGYIRRMDICVEPRSPSDPDSQRLLQELSATLAGITGDSGESSFRQEDALAERAIFVVARNENGLALGCGALRPIYANIVELKRMFARPATRGVGAAVLTYLEQQAAAFDYSEIWLETRRVNVRAVTFYQRRGYSEIPNFGKYVGRAEAICLGKVL